MRLSCCFLVKKPACWLFFSLLVGCQPQPTTVPGTLSFQQAQQAEQRHLPSKAYELYRQAALMGYTAAIEPTIRLAYSQNVGSQSLQRWYLDLPPSNAKSQAAEILGFWQDLPTSKRDQVLSELKPLGILGKEAFDGCVAIVQPVLSDQRSLRRWHYLSERWHTQPLAGVGICFDKPLVVDMRVLDCTATSRLQCNLQPLEPLALRTKHRLWLLLTGEGGANYQHGLVIAPVNAEWGLLTHELSHAAGFLDEYPLAVELAQSLCKPGNLSTNVMFSKQDVQRFAKNYSLQLNEISLTEIDTCRQIGLAAWRPTASTTNLQHHEYPLPDLYVRLMTKQLRMQPLDPIHYLLGLKAKERGDLQRFEQLMLQAAQLGYAPAELQIRNERNSTAR